MLNQLSLFDSDTNNIYWEYPQIASTTYQLLDIPFSNIGAEFSSYFELYFSQNRKALDKLLLADEVWIKPNITGAELWQRGKTSNPQVLDGLITFILKHKCKGQLFVADSSVIGCDTKNAAKVSGIIQVCQDNDIQFIDLRDYEYSTVAVIPSLLYSEIRIAKPFCKKNVFKINLGKIKSTYGSSVGFTIKNTKGIIDDDLKKDFHIQGVQEAICDLFECVPWDLAVLEGLPMSELGVPTQNGAVIISDSALATDYYTAVFLHALPEYSDLHPFHLHILSKRYGFDQYSFSEAFRLRCIETIKTLKYCIHGINQLEKDFRVVIHDGKPCSGCLESFAKAISTFSEDSEINSLGTFVLGPSYLLSKENNVLIGNCAIDNLTMLGLENNDILDEDKLDDLNELIYSSYPTPGCPPTIDEIKKTIKTLCHEQGVLISKDRYDGFDTSFPSIPLLILPAIYEEIHNIIPQESVVFTEFELELRIGCEVICAAICHQMNWDYLRNSILQKTRSDATWLLPERLATLDSSEVYQLFATYGKPERIRAVERCEILNDIGRDVLKFGGKYIYLFFNFNGNIADSKLIDQFFFTSSTFSDDPEQKKKQILLQNLSGFSELSALSAYCKPAIDYHIIRNYIRRGLVYPTTKYMKEKLYKWNVVKERTIGKLRSYCSEAMQSISDYSTLTPTQINTIDWWIGRSVCVNSCPDCLLQEDSSIWLKSKYSKCPFYNCCDAVKDYRLFTINEPNYHGKSY